MLFRDDQRAASKRSRSHLATDWHLQCRFRAVLFRLAIHVGDARAYYAGPSHVVKRHGDDVYISTLVAHGDRFCDGIDGGGAMGANGDHDGHDDVSANHGDDGVPNDGGDDEVSTNDGCGGDGGDNSPALWLT